MKYTTADAAEPRFSPGARPIAPRRLALSYPEASRARAEQFFGQTLAGYHDIEAKFGLRKYDIAGAIATFVAGNYIAYRDEPFPDAHFKPLVQQMRGQKFARAMSGDERYYSLLYYAYREEIKRLGGVPPLPTQP